MGVSAFSTRPSECTIRNTYSYSPFNVFFSLWEDLSYAPTHIASEPGTYKLVDFRISKFQRMLEVKKAYVVCINKIF